MIFLAKDAPKSAIAAPRDTAERRQSHRFSHLVGSAALSARMDRRTACSILSVVSAAICGTRGSRGGIGARTHRCGDGRRQLQ